MIDTKQSDNEFRKLGDYVTIAGQLRFLGDVIFANAEIPEDYDEAKQHYEDAIAYDDSLKELLQVRLNTLERMESNQRAQSYERQGIQIYNIMLLISKMRSILCIFYLLIYIMILLYEF